LTVKPYRQTSELDSLLKGIQINKDFDTKVRQVIYVAQQLKAKFYPAVVMNAEEKHSKRRKNENTKKMKNKKKKSLMKNVHKLSKMLGGPNVSYDMLGKNCQETQITRENMKVLDRKMLTPRYHLKPLEYMLQHEFFEESSKEGMISIINVLTQRQRIRKSTICKTP
jgi:hypothetical protein